MKPDDLLFDGWDRFASPMEMERQYPG